MKKRIRPIILAGGVGRRLLPLSTKSNPKQFLPIFKDLSLFDLTLQRVNNSLYKRPIIVTSTFYKKKVTESLERTGIRAKKVILEPESKNTLAAVCLATCFQSRNSQEESFIVLPSDHYFSNNKKFFQACERALNNLTNNLVLFGIKPSHPSTEFGYIKLSNDKSREVVSFIEKPDSIKAKKLFKSQEVYWNSGVSLFKGEWFTEEIKKINNSFFNKIAASLDQGKEDGLFYHVFSKIFEELEDLSFDSAFVEKCKKISMFRLDAGWSDLGSWFALGSFETNKDTFYSLFRNKTHHKLNRPWGYFQVLKETKKSKVKLILVDSNQQLNLQKNKFRSETWHVIKGKAKVTSSKEKFTLETGDSISLKSNIIYSIENFKKTPLEIIAIQTEYPYKEGKIVRIKDRYGVID